jgi:hypothetical protein
VNARRLVVLTILALGAASAAVALAADQATITGGPSGNSVLTTPTFTFAAPDAGGFECSLDNAPFAACTSPDNVGPLALGAHMFAVRTMSDSGPGDPVVVHWDVVAPLQTPAVTLASPQLRRLRPAQLTQIRGMSSAPSGVQRVEVALYRGRADKSYFPPACHFVDLQTGGPVLQPCLLPPYVRAIGTSRWHVRVPPVVRRHLRHGTYHLVVRALNAYCDATRREFALTVR